MDAHIAMELPRLMSIPIDYSVLYGNGPAGAS